MGMLAEVYRQDVRRIALSAIAPRSTAGAICHLLVWSCLAVGQDGPTTAAPRSDPASPPGEPSRVAESSLPIYYLKNEDGKLVAVPGVGWKFSDFEAAWKIYRGIAQQNEPPRYTVQRMRATGTVAGRHAELNVVVEVVVRGAQWVSVPLRLDEALLQDVQYTGPGKQVLSTNGAGQGYLSWIQCPTGAEHQHQLTLKVLVPLSDLAGKSRMKLLVPRAAVSEVVLEVPLADAVGEVAEPAILETPAAGNGKTVFTVRGGGGSIDLSWRADDGRRVEPSPVLQVDQEVLVRVDSQRVDTEAVLSITSHGAPFDRFRVGLPPGAAPVLDAGEGYSLTQDGLPPDEVEVVLQEKTKGPVEVRLVTRRPHDLAQPDAWFELAGFEVATAARQSGQIALAAVGQWQVQWRVGGGIRQIELDQLRESLRHKSTVAGFSCVAQGCSLSARLVPRVSRIGVEPVYLLLVEEDEVRLEAALPYTIRGAKASQFEIALPGWTYDRAEPETQIDVDQVKMIETDVVSIPLRQPSASATKLEVYARKAIPEGATSVMLALPQPRADSAGPATVVVVPADNVQLIPDDKRTAGLIRQRIASSGRLTDRQKKLAAAAQQSPWYYQADEAQAVFAAAFSVLPQSITATVNTRVNLDRPAPTVTQELRYAIEHVATDHLIVEMPRELAAWEGLQIKHRDHVCAATLPVGEEDPQDTALPLRRRIDLGDARIGPCTVTVTFPLPPVASPSETATSLEVPLAMPLDEHFTAEAQSNRLDGRTSPGIRLESPGEPWAVVQNVGSSSEQTGRLQLATDRRTQRVRLSLVAQNNHTAAEKTTKVEQAWVRTWLTHDSRQDRVVFRFTTDHEQLALVVPAGAAVGQTEVWLDGRQVPARLREDGRLAVSLPGGTRQRGYRLELWVPYAQPRPRSGRLSLEIPQLGEDVWVRQMYWQLVLPKTEHLVAAPQGFTNESRWAWQGFFWGRKPLMNQAALEDWIDAPHQQGVADGVNNYLFSTMGNVRQCTLRTANRSWIVLIFSGAALIVGLLLIYVPASRHPGTLLGVGAVLLCAGLLYPEPTRLVSQAACLGLALALLAGLLERGVARRRRGPGLPEPSSSILERGSSQTLLPQRPDGEQPSTQTAPTIDPPANSDGPP